MYKPKKDVPCDFRCPITFEIMEDPVEMDDGYTYEREAILKWMEEHSNQSPITHKKMSTKIKPNDGLKNRIQQYLNQKNDRGGNLQVLVKNLDDKTFILHVSEDDTVSDFKKAIRDKTGIPETEQRLLYQARQLNDNNKTLKDYNVKNDSTVHLLLKLVGGY